MREIIMGYQGEMSLKGLNRNQFESAMMKILRYRLKTVGKFKVYCTQSTFYMEPEEEDVDMDLAFDRVRTVFGLAALSRAVVCEKDFDTICRTAEEYLGDSLTQGMQIYSSGLPEASFCAYRGANPSVVVNGTTCKRSDGGTEVPMEVLTARQPPVLYILLGTNVLNRDGDYSSFLTYYRLMLDMISQALPNTQIYVQSITPVRPEVRNSHPGLYKERLCEINNELAAIALEKNCAFLNLWEALADDNGDLKAEYAQPDGIHIKPEGYPAWVEYLATHTVGQQTA